MALTVETGAGGSASDSYISVEDAVTYHTARGNVEFLHLPSVIEKERALRKATDHMTREYRALWKGTRVTHTQRLDWPRYDVWVDGYYVQSDSVPREISEACAELALRVLAGDLAPDTSQKKTEVKVGPITVKYADGSNQSPDFTAVDDLLSAFLKGGGSGNMIPISRA